MIFMPRNVQTKIPFHDEHIAKYILEKLTVAEFIWILINENVTWKIM